MSAVFVTGRYALVLLLRSQRFFAPLLLFVLGVVVLTAGDTGPVLGSFGACAFVLFPAALWITVALIATEDDVARSITVVNAGGAGRVLAGTVAVAVGLCVPAVAFGSAVPVEIGDHAKVPAAAVAAGVLAQLAAGLTGVAAGVMSSRLTVHRPAASLSSALALTAFAVALPYSPVRELAQLTESRRPPSQLVGPLLLALLVASVLVAGAARTAWQVSQRRA